MCGEKLFKSRKKYGNPMTESVGNAWKFAGRIGGGVRGGCKGGGEMICRLLGLKIGVANRHKTL